MHTTSSDRPHCAGIPALRRLRPALAAVVLAACGAAQAQEPYVSEMRAFAFGFCPKGWAKANGQTLAIATNSATFSLMGVAHGGNGINSFNLPDLRGRTPVGSDYNTQGGAYPLGHRYGQESVNLTIANMPAHAHGLYATSAPATHATPAQGALLAQAQNAGLYVEGTGNTTLATSVTGGSQAVPTRDPYLAITWCVALQGVFPHID